MRLQSLLLFLCIVLPVFHTQAQSSQQDLYSNEWKKIDSLLESGLPKSAATELSKLKKKAAQEGKTVQLTKVELYEIRISRSSEEDADSIMIAQAESHIMQTQFPLKALWQSVAAQLYWNYYQNNRYQILQRSRLAQVDPKDYSTWDVSAFIEKTSSLYSQSLSQSERLKALPIEPYDPILIKGENSRNLRPTLYDFLAFRALSFFSNDERDLTRPSYQFQLDDAALFAPASEFSRHSFKTKDTTSLHYQALLIYQDLLRLHANDKSLDAFLDADLSRLQFAYNHSVHPDKKELYLDALKRIEKAYPRNPLSALASVRLISLEMENNNVFRNEFEPLNDLDSPTVDLRKLKARLDDIVKRFPFSEGGSEAAFLRQSIILPMLSVVTEETNLPAEPFRVLIRYKNQSAAWLRILRITKEQFLENNQFGNQEALAKYLSIKPVHESNVKLPGSEDFYEHGLEYGLPALPAGLYAVVISNSPAFSKDSNIVGIGFFQTSRLAAIMSPSGEARLPAGFIMDRKTGVPVKNAAVRFLKRNWSSKQEKYTFSWENETYSSTDGSFTPSNQNQYYHGFELSRDEDHFYSEDAIRFYQNNNQPRSSESMLLFTDRNIYRPGQTIYFKGILLKSSGDRRKHDVIAGREQVVRFYDVNNQKIAEQKLNTNEWGSVSGQFTAPESGLMGHMRIETENGATHFSVEEYKRPSFKLGWDTLKTDYALNETVSIGGYAQAYAGYPLDGAQVRYRVVRQTSFPYDWYYWRWPRNSPDQEIAEGSTTTDSKGHFNVVFKALPDKSVDPKTLPVFRYQITTEVTDPNGETHSGMQHIAAGYRSIQISFALPEQASPKELDSLKIRTENLNGNFVETSATIRIVRLQAPATMYRKRVWPRPDKYVVAEEDFRKRFPLDPYRNEDDYRTWADAEKVLEQNFRSREFSPFVVPPKTFSKNGWYRISVLAKDKNGKEVEQRKFVQVFDPESNSKAASTLIVVPQQQTREPRESTEGGVGTGQDQLYVLRFAQEEGDPISSRGFDLDRNNMSLKRILAEGARGGIALSHASIKENRYYRADAIINVPWSNKDLNVEWGSHRSELQPGTGETWTLHLSGNKKEKVAAELVAGLYDASLDAFGVHSWYKPSLFPSLYAAPYIPAPAGFSTSSSRPVSEIFLPPLIGYEKSYDQLIGIGEYGERYYYMNGAQSNAVRRNRSGGKMAMAKQEVMAESAPAPALGAAPVAADASNAAPPRPNLSSEDVPAVEAPLRTNFQETAFFYPQLHTDSAGNVKISFSLPDAITEWKLLAFAHTKDLSTGLLEGSITTRKELMVQPNLPRFLQQGDDMYIATKVVNQSSKAKDVHVSLEIIDALNGKSLALPFQIRTDQLNVGNATDPIVQEVHIEKGASTVVRWKIHVPDSRYEPVTIRIRASTEGLSDGEEHILPVLTRRILVTESMPLWMNGTGSKEFRFDKLLNSASDAGLAQHRIVVEYTGNPAWNVVKSLPYLMEYPYECVEQTFNRYYANQLAAHILDESPAIRDVFKKWESESLLSSFKSPLSANQELKSALLEETPWVLAAQNEKQQRENIAELFNRERLGREQSRAVRKLEEQMLPEGGWSWFPGAGRPDRYITQYVLTGIGRLQHLGVADSRLNDLAERAFPYLERMMQQQYENLLKLKVNLNEQQISSADIQYLYLRSFFPNQKEQKLTPAAKKFYLDQAKKFWPKFNPYMKGMIALALQRSGEKMQPATILQSLRETAQQKEELGMYWMEPGRSWFWFEAPVESQSLLIEAFTEIGKDSNSISAMKRWLLKQKQTEYWPSTKATADACYALLLRGSDWLRAKPVVEIRVGDTIVDNRGKDAEAGSGYVKTQILAPRIKPEMGRVQLNISSNEPKAKDLPSWGAVYWQYFQDQDKVTSASGPLKIERALFVERNSASGPSLVPVKGELKLGEKVKVRITIRVDRDMEYVHLKDGRPAGLEPIDVHSGYQWGTVMGYYQSTRDLATHFFISWLPKGTHVLEYSLFATQVGDFSAGIANIQCMYAPEFTAHSAGSRVEIR